MIPPTADWPVSIRRLPSIIVVVLGGFWITCATVCGQESDPTDEETGILEQAGKLLDGKIRLSLDGQQLACRFPSREEAQAFVGPIRSQFGSSGGSSYGGDRWNQRFDGAKLSGVIGRGGQNYAVRTNKDAFYFHLFETESADRLLMFEGSSEDDFSLIILAGNQDVLRIRQSAGGAILAQRIAGDRTQSRAADSFSSLMLNHPEFVDEQVISVVNQFGLGMPPSIYSDEFIKHVLAQIGFSAERWAQFAPQLEGLDEASFQTREETAKQLEENFEKWQEAIRVGISRPDLSVECRSQLRKIYHRNADQRAIETQAIIDSVDLLNRVDYLAYLLGQASEERVQSAIMNRLQTVTGESYADSNQWTQYVAVTTKKPDSSAETSASGTLALGPLQTCAVEMSALINLTLVDGQIRFNRKAWQDLFDNKSVETLLNEIQDEFQNRNLPESWLNMGDGYRLDRLEYPHLLFERVSSRLQSQSSRPYISHNNRSSYHQQKRVSLNREFDLADAFGKLDMHDYDRSNNEHPAEYLKLHFREKGGPGFYVWVYELSDGFQMLLVAKESDVMIQWQQDKQGCSITDMRGQQITTLHAPTVVEFVADYESYLNDSLFPLFQKIGINVDASLGGPLSFVNVPYPDPDQK